MIVEMAAGHGLDPQVRKASELEGSIEVSHFLLLWHR
jgi:hypothetical protein